MVGEMFESLVPNDRGPLDAASNFSSMQAESQPFILVQTYQIPESISKMAVTQTRQGITSRQLLTVLSDSQGIVGIPYAVLDPRRPAHRDPTKDDRPRAWYVTHRLSNLIQSGSLAISENFLGLRIL